MPGFLAKLWNRLRPKAMFGGGTGYSAASGSRRMIGWNGSILGPNNITLATWEQLLRRSRDAIRNSAVAASAIKRFQSNIIGTGIVPHFTHPDPKIKTKLQKAWDKWAKQADFAGQLSFYGLQGLLARSVFEAGECFCRYHVVDDGPYFQLQLIESEQVPVYLNLLPAGDPNKGPWKNSVIREGIIFDQKSDRRMGYRIYKGGNPYDPLVMKPDGFQFVNVRVKDMIQVMEPLRPGALRGVPMMAAVLPLLYDLEGYADSERLRKRLSAMFAFFIQKNSADDTILTASDSPQPTDPGVNISKLEPGTIMDLLPGEEIKAPEIPQSGDYQSFMYVELHKFAAALGLTYEQLTGDMKGVNYSSARVALLEFRRSAEQFQNHIVVDQFCEPVKNRWMQEAVLAGELDLPSDYAKDPAPYEACMWISDGWEWVDPVKEGQAAAKAVRDGFSSREMEIRKRGMDPEVVDAQLAAERKREAELGIVTDTNANVVLAARETISTDLTTAEPDKESDQEANEEDEA